MDGIALAGRILFSFIFVMSGMNHLTKRGYMAEYAKSMGVPAAPLLVVVSGPVIIAGGLMIAAGIWGDLGALLIAAFLALTATLMHPFWRVPAEQRQNEMLHFMKDVTMAGAAVAFAALFNTGIGLTVTDPLFGL